MLRSLLLSLIAVGALVTACSSESTQESPPQNSGGRGNAEGGAGGASNSVTLCTFGDDPEKCDGSSAQSCVPSANETGKACSKDADCAEDSLCFVVDGKGQCLSIQGVCAEQCGGDFDCKDGKQCNRKTGQCVEDAPEGKSFGESCSSDDECRGICVAVDETHSECEEHCRVGAESGCDLESIEGSGVACAYFAYDLSDISVTQGQGDTGVCAQLCNCNDDCPGAQLCYPAPNGSFSGVCTGGVDLAESILCDDGSGGASMGGTTGQ